MAPVHVFCELQDVCLIQRGRKDVCLIQRGRCNLGLYIVPYQFIESVISLCVFTDNLNACKYPA